MTSKQKCILGLDISTSCIGFCLFNTEGSFVEIGCIPIDKVKNTYEKAQCFRNKLVELSSKYDITNICVEQNLQVFRPGLSSAKTLFSLAKFNGTVCFICFDTLGIEPFELNVNAARKLVGLKINRKSTDSTKDQVKDWVREKIVNITKADYNWPRKQLKSGPNKGNFRDLKTCYDMADAFVITLGYLYHDRKNTIS